MTPYERLSHFRFVVSAARAAACAVIVISDQKAERGALPSVLSPPLQPEK
jgi:hypothetical protein